MRKHSWRFAWVPILILAIAICQFPVFADVSTAIFQLRTASPNQQNNYTDATSFEAGQDLYVPVSINGVSRKIGGYTFTVQYDTSVLTYNKTATFSTVTDSNAILQTNDNGGVVTVVWDTTSKDTGIVGDAVILCFKVKSNILQTAAVTFKLNVKELYSLESGFTNISFETGEKTTTANIVVQSIPETLITTARKLENVTLESLPDIVTAVNLFNSLSPNQQYSFSVKYASEYTWLTMAQTRFNRLTEQANEAQIQAVADNYMSLYGNTLNLDASTVTLSDEQKVKGAKTAYGLLTSAVSSRLDKNIQAKLNKLLDAIEEWKDAVAEATEFRQTYNEVWSLTSGDISLDFDRLGVLVDESSLIFKTLSDKAKSLLTSELSHLNKLKDTVNTLTADNKRSLEIRTIVNDFQQQWLYVFTLNKYNVKISDKSAIEMMLKAYEKISDSDAKSLLSSRITAIKSLLTFIEEAGSSQEQTTSTITEYITGDSNTVIEKGDTVIQKEIVTQTKTVTNNQVKLVDNGFTPIMKALFILLAFSLAMLSVPILLYRRHRKICAQNLNIESIGTKSTVDKEVCNV